MGKKVDLDELIARVEEIHEEVRGWSSHDRMPDSGATYAYPAYLKCQGGSEAIGMVEELLRDLREGTPRLGPQKIELLRHCYKGDRRNYGTEPEVLAEKMGMTVARVTKMLEWLQERDFLYNNNVATMRTRKLIDRIDGVKDDDDAR